MTVAALMRLHESKQREGAGRLSRRGRSPGPDMRIACRQDGEPLSAQGPPERCGAERCAEV